MIGRGQRIVVSGLTEVMVFIWIVMCESKRSNVSVADPEGGGEDVRPPPKIKKKDWERVRGGRGPSVSLLSISAFIYSPVKCNKSLYIFTRCIDLLVYLITFELLKQSTINQKTKWYYHPLDINFIKIHPFYTSIQITPFSTEKHEKIG
jgi:hypothetical protein